MIDSKGTEHISILLVEDKDFDARLIEDTLTDELKIHHIIRARNKQEYIQKLDHSSFQLILCDYTLPEMSDLEALIIANEKLSETPFIYMSDIQNDKSGLESLKKGASDFIFKENLHRLAPSVYKAIKEWEYHQQIKQLHKNIHGLTNYIDEMVIIIDEKEIIQYANPQAAEFVKSNPEKMKGLHLSNLLDKKSYFQLRHHIKKTIEDQSSRKSTIETVLPYGSRKLSARFLLQQEGTNGHANTITILIKDIPENKKQANNVVQTDRNHDILFQNAPDAFYIRDLDGYILNINKAAEQISGYTEAEVVGKHFFDLNVIPSDQKKSFLESMQTANKVEDTQPKEFEIISKEGKTLTVEKTAYAFTEAGKKKVLGIVRDITPRKEAEKRLKESEEKFKALVKSTEDMVLLIDRDHTLKGMYGKGFDKIGIDTQKHKGQKVENLFSKEIADIHKTAIDKAFKGGLDTYSWTIRYSGEQKYFQTSLSPIYNENNEILQLVGIGRDMTNIQEMLKELEEAKEKAEEHDRLKTAFLANISHEIRTPMNAILGFTQLLKSSEFPKEKQREFLEIIHGRGDHLLQIINDIIDISKIESNQLDIEPDDVAVKKTLKELFTFYAASLQQQDKNSVELIFDNVSDQDTLTLYTDKERLEQILSNLLDNAIKFTSEGTVHFGYQIIADDNTIQFYVSDSGIGIEKGKHHLIFKPFRQVEHKLSTEYEGTGLGLAITKQLVERMGGEIWVHSSPGEGSTFYFTLPHEKANQQALSHDASKGNGTLNLEGKTILVVEDDAQSRAYLKELLSQTHADLLLSENGTHAWEYITENQNISLVLMDIRLPDINGLELTKKIKDLNTQIPIIAQTAHAMAYDRNHLLSGGCDDYIPKPIHKTQLFYMIKKHIL